MQAAPTMPSPVHDYRNICVDSLHTIKFIINIQLIRKYNSQKHLVPSITPLTAGAVEILTGGHTDGLTDGLKTDS